MNDQFLIDTNVFVSYLDPTDVFHQRAKSVFAHLRKIKGQIFISDILLNETLTVLARRCESRGKSDDFPEMEDLLLKHVLGIPVLCIYQLFEKSYKATLKIMRHWRGRFNFHDSLLLYFLEAIPEVTFVTFDRDFKSVPHLKVLDAVN